jgi:hypothetical protein
MGEFTRPVDRRFFSGVLHAHLLGVCCRMFFLYCRRPPWGWKGGEDLAVGPPGGWVGERTPIRLGMSGLGLE